MKLADILANVSAIIKNSTYINNPDPIVEIYTCYVIEKLKATLKAQIDDNPNKSLDIQSAKELFSIIKDVNVIVADTDLVPPHNPRSLLTVILLALSKQLATVLKLSKYEILLPSLKITEYAAAGRIIDGIDDADLLLNDFVLSDDNTAIIEVFSCLSQASIHGELKHGYLENGQTLFLSQAEQERVINHSFESKQYWEAIKDRIYIVQNGESFGAVLLRLAEDLRKGGVHGKELGGSGGQEYKAGLDADYGIINFFIWLHALSEKDREFLESFEDIYAYIKRLGYPGDSTSVESFYCVEVIAVGIERLLGLNPILFDTYPENTKITNLYSKNAADLKVKLTETALLTALKNSNYLVTSTYGHAAYYKLIMRVCGIPDLLSYVSVEKCNMIFSPLCITSWLLSIEPGKRLFCLKQAKPILDVIKFTDCTNIFLVLETILNRIQQKSASKILAKQIASVIHTITDLKMIADFFGENLKFEIYAILYNASPGTFEKNLELFFSVQTQHTFNILRKRAITYLVDGECYNAETIPFWKRLTIRDAIQETADLKYDQLRALISLYMHGLRGEHLRSYQPCGNHPFGEAHLRALEGMLKGRSQQLSPIDAIRQISKLTIEDVVKLPKTSNTNHRLTPLN
jgi:hypothetical protein